MKDIQLFEAVGDVDDDILQDAEEFLQRERVVKPRPWVKWGGLAACVAVAVCALWALPRQSADFPVDAPPPQTVTLQGQFQQDRPAIEPEKGNKPVVQMNWNQLTEAPPDGTGNLFALMWEDFVPMTREELLDYFGVTLPIEEVMPALNALPMDEEAGFGRGIYRSESRNVYFDTTTFAFESADGALGVYVTLDRAFHMPTGPWELPGDKLEFTAINGWELALFRYPDGEGNICHYVEFSQNGVNYRVCGKNICEGEFAAVLCSLLEEREAHTPGEPRAYAGKYSGGISLQVSFTMTEDGCVTEEWWQGTLGLDLDDGSGYLRIELTPAQAEQFSELSIGDRVAVTFTGEPAAIGTVWTQQLISVEKVEG